MTNLIVEDVKLLGREEWSEEERTIPNSILDDGEPLRR